MAYHPQYYNGGFYQPYQNGATPDMLNQYKGQYQQPQMQNMQPFSQPYSQPIQQPIQMPTPTNDMIFVLNEAEATSYPVAPNNSVILWDKNNDVVYIKSVNAQNIPSFRVLDYKERTADNAPKMPVEHECKCGSNFVSKEDFKALQSEFEALQAKVQAISTKPKTKTAKVIVEDENDG